MEVLIVDTPKEAAAFAASAVLDGLRTYGTGNPVLGLATGSSPAGALRRTGRGGAARGGRFLGGPGLRAR